MLESKLLGLAIFVAASSAQAAAQAPIQEFDTSLAERNPHLAGWFDERDAARAMFDVSRASVKELNLARLEAARGWYGARIEELLAGKVTLDVLLESAQKLMEAEASLAVNPAERIAVLEKHWRRLLGIVHAQEVRFQSNKASLTELSQARVSRLSGQIEWLRAGGGLALKTAERLSGPVDWEDEREFARLLFEASRLRLEDLLRARFEKAREGVMASVEDLLSGKVTIDALIENQARMLDAEQAMLGKDADLIAIAEARWAQARAAEVILQVRFESGKSNTGELAQAQYRRQRAERALAQERAREHKQVGKRGPILILDLPKDVTLAWRLQREVAAVRADANPTHIAQRMIQAAREAYQAREEELLAGKATIDILLENSANLLEAELARYSRKADRVAAHERHWRRNLLVERVLEVRLGSGHANLGEVMQARHARLDAQIGLEEAKASKSE
jgi:hypothetical protein